MPHSEKDVWKENATKLLIELSSRDVCVYMDEKLKGSFDDLSLVIYEDLGNLRQRIDFILTLGGDGTIIRAAKYASARSIPLLGINIGHTGYLAELDTSELPLLERVFAGDYTYDERAMCDVDVRRRGEVVKSDLALNDVVITRGIISRPIPFQVIADGTPLNSYLADGIIIATPTGSTAYSLSAGGPVVEPTAESLIVTPIAPHMLSARPIIMSNKRVMNVLIGDLSFKDAYVTSDGMGGYPLSSGDVVSVYKSERVTKLIRVKKRGFYDILSEKL